MYIDKTTEIGRIIGMGMIFEVFSMTSLPKVETKFNAPGPYQTIRSKLPTPEINLPINVSVIH